jgi:membrane protein
MVIPGIKVMSLGQLLKLLWRRYRDHAVPDRAAQLSYYFLFSLFSFLFVLVTLAAYLPLEGALSSLLARAAELMPPQAFRPIQEQLDALLHRPHPRLLTGGVVVALWSASRGVDAIRSALNLAYDVKESRPFWKVLALAILMTLALAALVLIAVALIVLGGKLGLWLAQQVHLGREYLAIWSVLRWPATALIIMLVLALTYYLLPDVEQEFKFISSGSVIGALLWLAATWGFTYYVEHFANYNLAYGSVAGVAILLTWLYMSGLIFILGGEINAIVEQASAEGKERGSRIAGEPPPPREERPSAGPPGATKAAPSARRSGLP